MPYAGEQLAAARALSELTHELLADASATLLGGTARTAATPPPASRLGRHLPVELELIHPGG